MKSKWCYLFWIFLLIFLTILVVKAPSFYFDIYDKKQNKYYQVQTLNLTNIYDHYYLDIDQKLEILLNPDKNQLFFAEELSKNKYIEILEKVDIELEKIQDDLEKIFHDRLQPSYDDIFSLSMVRSYIYCDNDDSLTLRIIRYETNEIAVLIIMDLYDNTILSFEAYGDELLPYSDDFSLEDLSQQVHQNLLIYFNITEDDYYVENIIENSMIAFHIYGIVTDMDTIELDSFYNEFVMQEKIKEE